MHTFNRWRDHVCLSVEIESAYLTGALETFATDPVVYSGRCLERIPPNLLACAEGSHRLQFTEGWASSWAFQISASVLSNDNVGLAVDACWLYTTLFLPYISNQH